MTPMKATTALLTLLGLTLLATLTLFAVASAAPAPVNATVFQGYNVTSNAGPDDSWVARYNVTWRVSPDDPDQINGSLVYYRYDVVRDANGLYVESPTNYIGSFNFTSGLTNHPVPNNPGWLWSLTTWTGCRTTGCTWQDNKSIDSYVIANDTVSNSTFPCAPVSTNISQLRYLNTSGNQTHPVRSHFQCGEPLPAPVPGLQARVLHVGNATAYDPTSTIDLKWKTSPDDPNANGTGNWTYWMSMAFEDGLPVFDRKCTDGTGSGFFAAIVLVYCKADNVTGSDASGTRQASFEVVSVYEQVSFAIIAQNNATHQQAPMSCVLVIDTTRTLNVGSCGIYGSTVAGLDGEPTFPLLDVPAWTAATGFRADLVPWLLAAVLTLIMTVGGFVSTQGSPVGGGVGFVLSFPAGFLCFLLPAWFLILLFFAAALVIWFLAKPGGAEG